MKRLSLTLAASIAIGAAGCAGTPPAEPPRTAAPTSSSAATPTATTPSCSDLAAAVARAEGTRRAATEKERDAWKVVVPFAVAARYASNRAAASEAERQLAGLHAEQARQGCDRHAS